MLTALSMFSGFLTILCMALVWINYRLVRNLDHLDPAIAGNPRYAKAVVSNMVNVTIKSQDWSQVAILHEDLTEAIQTLEQHGRRTPSGST